MSEFICIKCGETAYSKCPHQRNVFPTDQSATMLDSMLAIHVVPLKDKVEAFFNLTVYRGESTLDVAKRLKEVLSYEEKTLEHAFCDHVWVRNSMTERDCNFECAHANLSDTLEVKKEKPSTFEDVLDHTINMAKNGSGSLLKSGFEKDASEQLFRQLKMHIRKFFKTYDKERIKLTKKELKEHLIYKEWKYNNGFWSKETEKGNLMVNKSKIKLDDFNSLTDIESFDLSLLDYRIREEVKDCMLFFSLS